MHGPSRLSESENCWRTAMGAWFPGEGRIVFRGKDLFQELNRLPWMGLLLYCVTGKIFSEKQIRLFEGMWALCASYPDPRLWNNRVAGLAGTSRSTAALGLGAAQAVSEASIYGRRPDIRAIDFLYRVKAQIDAGISIEELIKTELRKHRVIPGFGRPITRKDERLEVLLNLAQELGFASGPYLALAFQIKKNLTHRRYRMEMNVAALGAALVADQGLSPRQAYHYMILSFSVGMLACYIDASEKPEGTLFPLSCRRIDYSGATPREW